MSVNNNPSVVKTYPVVEDGFALPLERPGLGVTVDESAAAKIPFNNRKMQPRLKVKDGSVRDY